MNKDQFTNTIYLLCFLEDEINKHLLCLKDEFSPDQITEIEDYVFTPNRPPIDELYNLIEGMQ